MSETNFSLSQVKAHFNQLIDAIQQERLQEQSYFESIAKDKPIKTQVEAGLAVFPLRLNKFHYTVGDMIELHFEQTGNLEFKHKLKVGAGVQIIQPQGDISIYGVLSYCRRLEFKILVHEHQIDNEVRYSKQAFAVRLAYDSRPYDIMTNHLEYLIDHCGDSTLKDQLIGYFSKHVDASLKKVEQLQLNTAQFNISQINAIQSAYASFPYYIIHGPPGTGKTTTLVGLIKMLSAKEPTILVCAPSNNAVDLLAEKCAEIHLNVTRVGNVARVSDSLLHMTLNEKVRNHQDWTHIKKVRIEADEARRQAKKFKRSFGPEERRQRQMLHREAKELRKWARDLEIKLVEKVLSESQVIATTLIGAEHQYLKHLRFNTAIIDEASQALEPECWVPILKSKRTIFAGDHQQLPPTVKSQKAKSLGLEHTLFERLIAKGDLQSLLKTQYRMHDTILAFSNTQFYDSKLESDSKVADHTLRSDNQPLLYIDTAGTGFEEEVNPQHKSYKNPGEFFIIKEHLLSILERVQGVSIGIISPYKEQVRHMQSHLRETEELGVLDIQIDSIDGFQGQEKDVIYISLVRSNDHNTIGFLEDYRRLNVALTRARKKLVIVGDSSTLVNSKLYKSLIDFVEEAGTFKSAWEYMSY